MPGRLYSYFIKGEYIQLFGKKVRWNIWKRDGINNKTSIVKASWNKLPQMKYSINTKKRLHNIILPFIISRMCWRKGKRFQTKYNLTYFPLFFLNRALTFSIVSLWKEVVLTKCLNKRYSYGCKRESQEIDNL
jgi:hypothetical protein